jgi:hypothetical protein
MAVMDEVATAPPVKGTVPLLAEAVGVADFVGATGVGLLPTGIAVALANEIGVGV